jgi:putative membrane protein
MVYKRFLLATFVAVWTWAAIEPKFREDWLLENYLVFLFFPLIFLVGRYFELSNVSYTLIALFGTLHVIGSHYTYSLVPFGYTLQHWLGADRNMYDRLVHFCFGVLLAYPVREAFLRIAKVRGFWGYYLPLDVTLALSAVYEIIEWIVAAKVDPRSGLAFLGSQGDVWDAQKDMLLAGIGAFLAMLIVALIHLRYDKNFFNDLRQGFRLDKNDKPLGEISFRKLIAKRRSEQHRRKVE